MRLLIFGEAFLPPAYLPRVRYLCSYFIEKGWQVDLITESSENNTYIPENVTTLLVDYYTYKKGVKAKIEWSIKFLLNLLYDYKGLFFYKKSQQFLEEKQYDVVFCSSSFTFPLTTAAKISQKLNLPLFVDLRDIAEQSPDDNHYIANKPPKILGDLLVKIYKSVNLKRRNKVLKIANGITSVSPWHVQTLSKYNIETHLLYNGFDETRFYPEKIETDRFVISYFGRVYNEQMRNPRLLFSALQNLLKKGLILPENVTVKWYVDENSKCVIEKIVSEYGLEKCIDYHDFVHPNDLLSNMNKSSVLLVLCNVNSHKKYFGIMTTKFFEALGVNRPVLCIPNNNDNLSELIVETNCGLVSSESAEVESFLLDKFMEWKNTGFVSGTLNETIRLSYSRKKGAEILENLFLKTTKKH